MRIIVLAFLLTFVVFAAGCVPIQPEEPDVELVTLYVGPELVDCTGVGPMHCMQVKRTPKDDYQYFYDSIEGFDYEEGYQYEIVVKVEPVENVPADGSSLKYTLVETVSKEPVTH